jgi:glutathione S-transferase
MLTLYYRPACPYCQSVQGEAEALGLRLQLKDISADPSLVDELLAHGGKKQVPYLIDTGRGEKMYESQDIISYFNAHYREAPTNTTFGGLKIHQSDEVCETCQ